MSPTSNQPEPNRAQTAVSMKFVTVGGEVGCLTLLIVIVAVFGGIWLDRLLDTKPLFTIILVLGSAPLSLALTFYLAMRAVKNVQSPPSSGGKTPNEKEDEDQ